MTTPSIDTHQVTKVSLFAKLWPIFLSGLVLAFSFIFCLGNFYLFFNRHRLDFAILAPHNTLMAFLRVEVLPLDRATVRVIIWILAGIVFAAITRSILGKIAILLSFTAVIGLMLTGYFFGSLIQFIPVDSSVVESKSFNLGYLGDGSGGGQFHLYECDPQGMNCETVWQSDLSPYSSLPGNGSLAILDIDDKNHTVNIYINRKVVYTHPIE